MGRAQNAAILVFVYTSSTRYLLDCTRYWTLLHVLSGAKPILVIGVSEYQVLYLSRETVTLCRSLYLSKICDSRLLVMYTTSSYIFDKVHVLE